MSIKLFPTLRSQVEHVLATNIDARNDDTLLVNLVCSEFKYSPAKVADTIKRARRLINSEKGGYKYLPTDARVAIARHMNEQEWRRLMAK